MFLSRFYSTNDPEKLTSLDEYISRMKDDQDTILYLPGDSKESILSSPILEKYMKMNYEVLILDDPVDEYTTQHLTEYEKRKVKSIAKLDVKVLETKNKAEKKKLQKMKNYFMPLLNWIDPHCKTCLDLPHSQLRNSKVLRTCNRAQLAFLMVATRKRNFIKFI